jgi:hypothetical protein
MKPITIIAILLGLSAAFRLIAVLKIVLVLSHDRIEKEKKNYPCSVFCSSTLVLV